MFSDTTNRSGDHLVDTPGEMLSFQVRQVFEIVNYVILCSLVALFGIVTNIINMVVFCRQGFHSTMTISFMALAISDQCCLLTLEWYDIFRNPLFLSSDLPLVVSEVHTLLVGWPHVSFGRTTAWITAYITAERCLCITAPLAVKRIITPARATSVLVSIYFINFAVLLPEYCTSFIGWKFYPDRNRTLLGIVFTAHSEIGEGLVFLLHAVLLIGAFVCVTVLTLILVVKLKGASKWRQKATQVTTSQTESMSSKDKNATKMVVMISGLLICMYTPGIVLSLVRFIEPRFGLFGPLLNLFMVTWSFGFLLTAVNSSMNIFMYYSMSSKYRDTFNLLLAKIRPNSIKQ